MAAPDSRGLSALHAAALLMVDPAGLGGLALRAQAGPVREAWLACLRALMPAAMPLVRLPAQAGEDRLLGGIDLPATLAAGRPVLQQGLLAAADGGLLLSSMAERLPAASAAHLAAVLDQGVVRIERDGITSLSPARLAVVALDESLDEDEPLSAPLADRLGLWLDLSALSVRDLFAADADLADGVLAARQALARVEVKDDLVEALCAAGLALGVDSARAALFALRATRAAAALRGAMQADADDAALAVQLVLAPRATRQPTAAAPDDVGDVDQTSESDPERPDPPPPPESPEASPATDPPPDSAEVDEEPPESQAVDSLEDRLLEAALAAMPAGLLARLTGGADARDRARQPGRAGAASASRSRGRPLGARRGLPRGGARLHLIETLRAAAPWQRLRRTQAREGAPPILVRADDFHIRRYAQRRTTTTVFAIDASGSSALHRLAEAKGAVELLLAECYVRRDQVAVIAFRGRGAELLLPPTRSLVRARRSLAGLPGGGGTPLAAGIDAATALAVQVRRGGATPVVVLLTDGRANVARNGDGGRARAQEDAIAAARALRALGGHVLLIDTSVRPEPAAMALALALGARYLALPQADSGALSRAVQGVRA